MPGPAKRLKVVIPLIGIFALAGVDAETGAIMLLYLDQAFGGTAGSRP